MVIVDFVTFLHYYIFIIKESADKNLSTKQDNYIVTFRH